MLFLCFFKNFDYYNLNLDYIIFYFFWQGLGSILFFFSIIFNFYNISSCFNFVVFTSIFIKIGVFPFHLFPFYWSKLRSLLIVSFLVTFQKIPLYILINFIYSNIINFFLIFTIFVGCFFIFKSQNLKYLIISSSIYRTFWFMIIIIFSVFFFFLFYIFYRLVMNLSFLINTSFAFLKKNIVIVFSIFWFLIGLPPFSMFFFKFYLLELFFNISLVFLLSFWLGSFLALVFYFKFFYFNVFNIVPFYKSALKSTFSNLIFLIRLIWIFIFFFWIKLN